MSNWGMASGELRRVEALLAAQRLERAIERSRAAWARYESLVRPQEGR